MTRTRATRSNTQALGSKKEEVPNIVNNLLPVVKATAPKASKVEVNEELKCLADTEIAKLRDAVEEKKENLVADVEEKKLLWEKDLRATLFRIPGRIRSLTVREFKTQYGCDLLLYIEQNQTGRNAADFARTGVHATRYAGQPHHAGARVLETPAARRPLAGTLTTPAARKFGNMTITNRDDEMESPDEIIMTITAKKKKIRVEGEELDWADLVLPQNKHMLENLSQASLSQIQDLNKLTSVILEQVSKQQSKPVAIKK